MGSCPKGSPSCPPQPSQDPQAQTRSDAKENTAQETLYLCQDRQALLQNLIHIEKDLHPTVTSASL